MENKILEVDFISQRKLEVVKVINNEDSTKTVFSKWWLPITMSEGFYTKTMWDGTLSIKVNNYNTSKENIGEDIFEDNEEIYKYLSFEIAKIRFDYPEHPFCPLPKLFKEDLTPKPEQISREFILSLYFVYPEINKEKLSLGIFSIKGEVTLQSQLIHPFKDAETREVDFKREWLVRQMRKFLNSKIFEPQQGELHFIDSKRILEFRFLDREEYQKLLDNE